MDVVICTKCGLGNVWMCADMRCPQSEVLTKELTAFREEHNLYAPPVSDRETVKKVYE